MNKSVALLLAVSMALSACDSGAGKDSAVTAGPASALAPVATVAAPSPATVTRQVSANGMLTVDPAVIDTCTNTGGVIASEVSWDASAARTDGVEVYLQTGDEKKLWSAAAAVGKETTGAWLQDGSQVILVNGADKQELARIVIKAQPCAGN